MKTTALLSTILTLTSATALPPIPKPQPQPHTLTRRDPSNQSGNSQFVLQCEGETLPQPGGANGEGEGGFGYFYSNMLFNANGTKISPSACTAQDSFCSNCLFSGGGLSSPTNVTGCWNPPAGESGCSITFAYNGYNYDSQTGEPYCGHQSGFAPFSFDLSAICYFNV